MAVPGPTHAFLVLLVAVIVCLCRPANSVLGRLTELRTERVPVLAHKLHTVNMDLKALSHRAELGPGSGFRLKNGNFHVTRKGGKRVRLVQTYANYEVYGPSVAAELDINGYYTGQMYGEAAKDLHRDILNPEACRRDVNALVNKAIRLEKVQNDQENIDKRDGRRVIFADPEESKAKIVYVVNFFYYGNGYISNPMYYIDACTTSVLFHYDNVKNFTLPKAHPKRIVEDLEQRIGSSFSKLLKFKPERKSVNIPSVCSPSVVGLGGNGYTGKIAYNTPPFCLPATVSSSTCTLESVFGKVVDNDGSESETKETAVSFPCDTGYSDAINGAFGVANDALFFGHVSGRMYQEVYGVTALNKKPRLIVHYGRNVVNAFWTGEDMFFGDGNSDYYPFVALDIVAHELSHGFTTANSNLIYKFQMGGMDEAFCDIAAAATIYFLGGVEDWVLGQELFKSKTGAIRYMNDPPKDGRSIKSIWRYHPLMDVHYSSGVFNYAFYKLVETENVNVMDGFEDFMVANRDIWGRLTRFRKGACGVTQASYDNGHEHERLKAAFRYVGIGLRFCDHTALKTTLFPGETRENIMVKKERSPILEVNMRKWRGVGARVKAEDSSPVRILAASDPDMKNVITKGINLVEFPANRTMVYLQLKSDHAKDVKVTLRVLGEK